MKMTHFRVEHDGQAADEPEMRSVKGLAGLKVQRKPTQVHKIDCCYMSSLNHRLL